MKFVDREEELKALEEGYISKKASFIIIYGRRRLGKTELIKQFLKGRNGVYFLATDEDITKQLKSLSSLIGMPREALVMGDILVLVLLLTYYFFRELKGKKPVKIRLFD